MSDKQWLKESYMARFALGWMLRIFLTLLMLIIISWAWGHTQSNDILALAVRTDDGADLRLYDMHALINAPYMTGHAYETLPAWSPTGDTLAFVSDETGTDNIYVGTPPTREYRQLTQQSDGQKFYNIEWSPDGTQLVAYITSGSFDEIYVFDAITGEATQVFSGFLVSVGSSVRWSPDSQRITFSVRGEGSDNYENVFVVDSNGANLRQLTDDYSLYGSPDWSADGSELTFVALRSGVYSILVMNNQGQNVRDLIPDASSGLDPAWSPTGDWIAFASNESGTWDNYIIRPDGTNRIALGVDTRMTPLWSPDGQALILFPYGYNITKDFFNIVTPDGQASRMIQLNMPIIAPPVWRP
jgi:Tol biopolymer transport system component